MVSILIESRSVIIKYQVRAEEQKNSNSTESKNQICCTLLFLKIHPVRSIIPHQILKNYQESFVRKQKALCSSNLTLLSKIKAHVISNQYKRRPLLHVRVAVTSHPLHGLVKRVTSAFSTNKVIIELTH